MIKRCAGAWVGCTWWTSARRCPRGEGSVATSGWRWMEVRASSGWSKLQKQVSEFGPSRTKARALTKIISHQLIFIFIIAKGVPFSLPVAKVRSPILWLWGLSQQPRCSRWWSLETHPISPAASCGHAASADPIRRPVGMGFGI